MAQQRKQVKVSNLTPIFVSVKEAAQILGISTWSVYQKLDKQEIPSQYEGRKRLVRYADLQAYADSLPTTPPVAS